MRKTKSVVLDSRLSAVAGFVRFGSRAADIGTDHALLPVYLVQRGICTSVIAADIKEGPLERAKANIDFYGLNDKIKTCLCDGLQGIDKHSVDDIIIAGLGGETIAKIIDAAPWLKFAHYNLVLQPMTMAERLRKYLFDNGFAIEKERAISAGKKLYTVIKAGFDGKVRQYDLARLYVGEIIKQPDAYASQYIKRQIQRLTAKAHGMKAEGRPKPQVDKYIKAAKKLSQALELRQNS